MLGQLITDASGKDFRPYNPLCRLLSKEERDNYPWDALRKTKSAAISLFPKSIFRREVGDSALLWFVFTVLFLCLALFGGPGSVFFAFAALSYAVNGVLCLFRFQTRNPVIIAKAMLMTGRCPHCAFDIGDVTAGPTDRDEQRVCPECGFVIAVDGRVVYSSITSFD